MEESKIVQERYFTVNNDPSIQKINELLEIIYDTNLSEEDLTLEKVLRNEEIDLKILEDIKNKVNFSISVLDEFLSYEYEIKEPNEIKKKVVSTKKTLDNSLIELKQQKEMALLDYKKELYNHKENKILLKVLRDNADSLDDALFGNKNFVGIYNLIEKPCMNIDIEVYHVDRSNINSIKNRIDHLMNRYRNFETSTNLIKELKKLKKESRFSDFRKSLAIECEEASYYEGIIQLKDLHEEIKTVIKKPVEYVTIKKSIDNEIQKLIEIRDIFESNGDDGSIEVDDIFYRHKNNLYLKEKNQEYVDLYKEVFPLNSAIIRNNKNSSNHPLSESSSLPLYVYSLGTPDNVGYIKLKNILEGKNGEKNWDDRFENFCKELDGLKMDSDDNRVYLRKLSDGIKDSFEHLDSINARKAYNSIITLISS